MGGIDLDLREATLDPAGAMLVAEAMLGGVKVTVPAGWHVTVEQQARAGGVLARVTEPEDLPADAPRLRVRHEQEWAESS